jgi:dipeptidyl aminopeptidase/acylaminoacyl peptidase
MTPMNGGYGPYLGCTNGSPCAAAERQSAITYLSAKTPPFLIVQGVEDKVVPFAQAQKFFDAMQAKGLQARLLLLPGVGHGLIGATPEATKSASLQA